MLGDGFIYKKMKLWTRSVSRSTSSLGLGMAKLWGEPKLEAFPPLNHEERREERSNDRLM